MISNHQSILDILLVDSLRSPVVDIKDRDMKSPVLCSYLRMADYLVVDRGAAESKELMLERSLMCSGRGLQS